MLRLAVLTLLIAAAGGTVAGCGDPPIPVKPADLDGKTFVSTSVEGRVLVDDTQVKLVFEAGRLAASAGCNTFAGAYRIEGGVLTQTDAIETLMGCSQALQSQDAWLGEFLAKGAKVTQLEYTLSLSNADTRITFKKGQRSGPPPVVGTRWTLVSSDAAGTEAVVDGPNPPTLELTKDGNAKIFTGCNRGAGPATFADGFVTFGPIATTQMACEPPINTIEQTMLKVLDGKAAAGFSGEGDLSLAKDGTTLLFRAG